ncbi:hypothetical protein CHS0354_020617 [Potamilus streckersoni]|uniref:C-type lectin domain-containing protein n=1 Tax=Potamilus streckersoni TaxID=2493646 RepID=A0AAE0SQ80_9BIVA|nr:hypothetical protein CHS0354_020617 [Potamilus streckersoni]
MKLSCLLLIFLTNILLRLSAHDLIFGETFRWCVILAVLLAWLLASFQEIKSLSRFTAAADITTTTARTTTTIQLPAATSTTTTTQTVPTLSSSAADKTTTTAVTTTTVQLPAETSTTTTPRPFRCPSTYTLYSGPGINFCFRLSDDCLYWLDARASCQMEGADLASVDDESLMPFLKILEPYLSTASNCEEQFAYLGARIDATGAAIFINGVMIPKDSPIWIKDSQFKLNSCVAAIFDNGKLVLGNGLCDLSIRYVCQHLI